MMRVKIIKPLALALISVLSIGTTAITVADTPTQGGTLVMALQQTPRHLNPAVQSGIATGVPGAQLFAAPLRYDDDWTPQPYLAESWEVAEDGLSVTLNLVEDAVFHDGEPITSSDVAFSVKTIQENHPFKAMFEPVTEVEIPDEHTAIIKLSKPHPALMLAMSSVLMPIIPEHIYGDGQDIQAHPRNSENVVGSGPFKLTEFKRDEHVILERFDDFFIDNRPYLDRVVMRIIKDPSARSIGLENGELQLSAFESVARDINRWKENDELTATADGYAAVGPLDWLAFNTASGNTADVNVRQAIAYAIDRNFILNAIHLGIAEAAFTGIYPGGPLYEPDVETYELDIDKANALLDDAGYEKDGNGTRFSLNIDYGWPEMKPNAEYVKAALKKIGIDVNVRASADFPTWAKRISNYEFDMTWDTVFNWGDPVIGVHRTYVSSNIKPGVIWSNTQSYKNDEVDEILAEAGVEQDPGKRAELYSQFQKIVANDLPLYTTNTVPYHTVYNSKVENPPLGIWSSLSPLDRLYLKAE